MLVAVLGTIFLVCGGGLAAMAMRQFSRRRAFVRGSSVAPGVVVAIREERDGTDIQPMGYPRVRFQATSGREITFESRMARGINEWAIGRSVSVRYRDAQPETAEIDSLLALWGAPVAFAALALVFLSVGLGMCVTLLRA